MAEEKSESSAVGFMLRQLGAIGGAITLLNLIRESAESMEWLHRLRETLQWQHGLLEVLNAFRAFTRPVATFLFGWLPALIRLPFPGWVKDYLTVGVVTALALVRVIAKLTGDWRRVIASILMRPMVYVAVFGVCFVFWPVFVIVALLFYVITSLPFFVKRAENKEDFTALKGGSELFFSVYIYTAAIIIINYVFIFAGARVGE
jgi:hypothetical protein